MITRAAALAHSPRVWKLVGPMLVVHAGIAVWNVWTYREELLDRGIRLIEVLRR